MKKKLVALIMIACMSLSVVGCSNKSENTSGTNSETSKSSVSSESDKNTKEAKIQEVTIQFMHQQVEQERQDAIQKIIDGFEAQNPGIKVEQMPVNEDDYDTKVIALGGSGQLPAIIELGQDQAKANVKNQFTDLKAVADVIASKGESEFFEGVLPVVKTEDGSNYIGVPVSGWVQGIWVNKAMLAQKGFDLPESWNDVLEIAKAFYDTSNKMYGISIPTSDSAFTEQVFSQFALSNNANVFDGAGNVTFDTKEMKEAMEFYAELAKYSMPGSTQVADVRDAFVSQNAPMALYSTYILGRIIEAGFMDDLAIVLPTNKESAAYGTITVLSISEGIEEAQTEAAKKFLSYLLEDAHNIEWLHIAPGGVQPVLKAVGNDEAYLNHPTIQAFASISDDIANTFNNLQVFGSIDGKNFEAMGDITNKGIISKALNNIIILGAGGADTTATVASEAAKAQKEIEKLMK